MQIFNTKKIQEEWQKKVEESYKQGKQDAENGFNNLLNAVTKDKETWNSLTEKELLIEIMLALKFNNNNVESLNNKISYIQNYKDIFKELNNNIDVLKKSEESLNNNIETENAKILEFKELINNVMQKINDIDTTLKDIINIKDNINNVIRDINDSIPKLKETNEKINNIAKETNDIIKTYSDSPAEILKEIYDKTDTALSEYDSFSLYSKIEGLKSELSNLNSKLDTSLNPYGFDSLYSTLSNIESKIDSINFSN